MGRYFDVLKAAIEAHGGSVQKFIGDAVVAIFGVPAVHEDDALRAVRSAVQARVRLQELNVELADRLGVRIEARAAINTGEVVVSYRSSAEGFVVGDVLNVAARLEQSAAAGEVLLGESTYALVREAVRAEKLEPLVVKGKARPLHAYRLLELLDGHARLKHRSALVGRAYELRLIEDAFARLVHERAAHLFTVHGPAGIGKSRLVEEATGACPGATVLSGRCLPYGEGITFWPLAEILRSAAGIRAWASSRRPTSSS